MAVANTFVFDNESTSSYGVVIDGPGEYKAPKRAVEVVSIPGRNGAIIIDEGYYENIELEYRCVIQAETQAEFREAVADFRNMLLSKIGYKRLTESYHPDEYRMAAYSSGLDEDPDFVGRSAIFKVKFNCMPQRFLTAGESEITINENPETLTNPTLYAAHPLISVDDAGTVEINDSKITVKDVILGDILLATSQTGTLGHVEISTAEAEQQMNIGDDITLHGIQFTTKLTIPGNLPITGMSVVSSSTGVNVHYEWGDTTDILVTVFTVSDIGFYARQSVDTDKTLTARLLLAHNGDTYYWDLTVKVKKFKESDSRPWTVDIFATPPGGTEQELVTDLYVGEVDGNSTMSAFEFASTAYIDCETGEAFMYKSGSSVPTPINSAVSIGAKLPELVPGENSVSYSGDIGTLKIIPRWWQL